MKIVNNPTRGLEIRDETQNFTIGTLADLQTLRDLIDAYLQKRGQTEYIITFHAIRLAKAEGYDLPNTTVGSACKRGTIPNAKKLAGRWQMPKPAFEQWYADWKVKQKEMDQPHE